MLFETCEKNNIGAICGAFGEHENFASRPRNFLLAFSHDVSQNILRVCRKCVINVELMEFNKNTHENCLKIKCRSKLNYFIKCRFKCNQQNGISLENDSRVFKN